MPYAFQTKASSISWNQDDRKPPSKEVQAELLLHDILTYRLNKL